MTTSFVDKEAHATTGAFSYVDSYLCGSASKAAANREVHVTGYATYVDDEQLWPAEEAQALAQGALALGLGQRGDELGERAEVDAAAGLHRLDPERYCQVSLPAARETRDILPGINPVKRRSAIDFTPAPAQRWRCGDGIAMPE
jgi:hypothetical protein